MIKTIPIGTIISFFMDIKGCRYWVLKPRMKRKQYRSIYPLNLGYFPVVASLMIF
ncbi:hypothetical protein [Thalassobacillus sp. C254]|uniref:hypothetical protein n=1 Tax=Thalassobacillus sp. C254 TaxID=1225341 RepID=UPI0018DCCDAA|nr:hypothetical protein [Thalassobacillus sp. C254]